MAHLQHPDGSRTSETGDAASGAPRTHTLKPHESYLVPPRVLSTSRLKLVMSRLKLVTLRSCDRHLGRAIGATARGSDAMSGSPTPLMDTKTSPARLRPLAKPFRSRSLSSAEWHVARMRLTTYPRRHASEGSEPTWLDRRDDHAVLLRGLNTGRQAKVLWSQLEA